MNSSTRYVSRSDLTGSVSLLGCFGPTYGAHTP